MFIFSFLLHSSYRRGRTQPTHWCQLQIKNKENWSFMLFGNSYQKKSFVENSEIWWMVSNGGLYRMWMRHALMKNFFVFPFSLHCVLHFPQKNFFITAHWRRVIFSRSLVYNRANNICKLVYEMNDKCQVYDSLFRFSADHAELKIFHHLKIWEILSSHLWMYCWSVKDIKRIEIEVWVFWNINFTWDSKNSSANWSWNISLTRIRTFLSFHFFGSSIDIHIFFSIFSMKFFTKISSSLRSMIFT